MNYGQISRGKKMRILTCLLLSTIMALPAAAAPLAKRASEKNGSITLYKDLSGDDRAETVRAFYGKTKDAGVVTEGEANNRISKIRDCTDEEIKDPVYEHFGVSSAINKCMIVMKYANSVI